jgi:DNA polymerase
MTPNNRTLYINLLDDIIDYYTTGFRTRGAFSDTTGLKNTNTAKDLSKKQLNDIINGEIEACTKCELSGSALNSVPGKGNLDADVMFIGEGPGEMEDIKGEPFVGKAGQLLARMLAAINLRREEVFITNIVKHRPPLNRNPLPEEVAACFPYLERQIELIDPLIICCLGGPAAQTLLKSNASISKLRGTIHRYRDIPLLPTYHPAAVLRFPEKYKRDVWEDLKLLRDFYKDLKK